MVSLRGHKKTRRTVTKQCALDQEWRNHKIERAMIVMLRKKRVNKQKKWCGNSHNIHSIMVFALTWILQNLPPKLFLYVSQPTVCCPHAFLNTVGFGHLLGRNHAMIYGGKWVLITMEIKALMKQCFGKKKVLFPS